MAGPLPPLIGGMASVIDGIERSSLKNKVNLTCFDTAKKTPEKRSLMVAIRARILLWHEWISIIRKNRVDIAHIHTCSGFTFFLDAILMMMAKVFGVKVILHIHGAKFDEFLSDLNYLGMFFVRRLTKIADAMVVLSDEWTLKLRPVLPSIKITVIPNGIPPHQKQSVDHSGAEIRVLFLGNLCKRKGVLDLLLVAKGIRRNVKIFLVGGEEDEGIGEQVIKHIEVNGLENNIEWVGQAVGNKKIKWLTESDIFILPSYAEGLPMSLLEAMAYRLPVIVTPVGGIPSVIQNNVNGLLIEAGDISNIILAVNRLADDKNLRETLGHAAKKLCENQFGIEKTVDCYMNLYDSMLVGK